VANVIDPLGGSYFVEALTDEIERQAEAYFATIDEMGGGSMLEGMLVGIERGYFQSEIAEAAFREQTLYEKGRLIKVGVNGFVSPDDEELDILEIPMETEARQLETLRRVRAARDGDAVSAALARLKAAAATDENLIPLLVDCARAECSEGEIVIALQDVFGTYTEAPRF
jgi:methylmalonyl-CoA mutase N-terminal domain/subunit